VDKEGIVMALSFSVLLTALMMTTLLASCSGGGQLVVEHIAQKTDCEAQGRDWKCPTAVTCECVERPTVTPEPTVEPVVTPAPVILVWEPLGITNVDPALGKTSFTLRGIDPNHMPEREWFLLNVKGRLSTGWMQVHPIAWRGGNRFPLTSQRFDPTRSETTVDHNIFWRAGSEYRFELSWSKTEVTLDIFQDGNRITHQNMVLPEPFISIDEIVIGNGIFPGYPSLPGVEIRR